MSRRRWSFIWPLAGMTLFVGVGLLLVTNSSSGPSSPSTKASAPPPPTAPSQTSDAKRAPADPRPQTAATLQAARARETAGTPEAVGQPATGPPVAETSLKGHSPGALLKSYEDLWVNPDPAELRAAELALLTELDQLPPSELVTLLRHGLGTRSANLVLIALENAMRGPRRGEYEDALAAAIKAASEQPEQLEILAGIRERSSSWR